MSKKKIEEYNEDELEEVEEYDDETPDIYEEITKNIEGYRFEDEEENGGNCEDI